MRTVLLILAGAIAVAAAEPVAAASRIDQVTVYLDRAWVTRSAAVTVPRRGATVVFADLPSELDEQSLRVAAPSGVRIDGVQSRSVFLTQRAEAEVRALEDAVRALEARKAELDDRHASLRRAAAFLDQAQESPFKPAADRDGKPAPRPSVEELKALLAFLDQARETNAAELRRVAAEHAALAPQLAAQRAELEQARGASSLQRREVSIAVNAAAAGQTELRLSYLVPGALWVPVYDARADAGRTSVELAYDALVQQATGEDWSDAQLTLSAARPAQRVEPPRPAPWYLSAEHLVIAGEAQEFSSVGGGSWSPSANLRQQRGNRSSKYLNAAHDELLVQAAAIDAVCLAVEQRSTSAVFTVAGRTAVASTGKPHRVAIARVSLPMQAVWHAVPKESLNTYVTGRVANATELPLLPGAVNVFVAGDLIGAASLAFVAPRETAELWLGVDEQVKVQRLLDEKRSGKTFLSKRKRLEAAYSVRVQSFRTAPVAVALYESLPVSQDERIRASIEGLDPRPATLDRGMARWDLVIPPQGEKTVSFAWTIEYPNDLVVAPLQQLEQQMRTK